MAITSDNAKLLFYAKKMGVSFNDTLTLGRQHLTAKKRDIIKYMSFFQNYSLEINEVDFKSGYAEPLFKILGAVQVNSLDYSNYEGASILHDMNIPIPTALKDQYTAVIDGGTMEHIFNFPTAIKNCMEALKVGGHYISFTPANNTLGHGFYQFSPELFYRIFCKQNGFKLKLNAVHLGERGNWFAVSDPEVCKNRIMLVNSYPTHLIIVAEKIKEVELFSVMPQQSDYKYVWNLHEAQKQNKKIEQDSWLLYIYKKTLPLSIRLFNRKAFDFIFRQPKKVEALGNVNPAYFEKIDIGI